MNRWNYVVTAHKPTCVTHSCVGNFTSPHELNLIVAKCTRLEIHVFKHQQLQALLDVPIHGRIRILKLFRPHGQTQDFLFIATEGLLCSILQWDAESSKLVTRIAGDVSDFIGRPTENGEFGVIDPKGRLIGLHFYDGLFKVIPFDHRGRPQEAYNIRLDELLVMDIKFLLGCEIPTIAVLYQGIEDVRHIKTYVVSLERKDFLEGPWLHNNLGNGAGLLIPVPKPLGGVIVTGEETIVYCNDGKPQVFPIKFSITRAWTYMKKDKAGGFHYLLGDHAGLLFSLVITGKKESVAMNIQLLGETSIASTISYLDNEILYVGSSSGDSQLVKIHSNPDAKASYIEALERYTNLGPIADFCVVDLERQGTNQVITCSGVSKDGSIRIFQCGIRINEQVSLDMQSIKGLWSLKACTDDPYETFLVISFITGTRVLAMVSAEELVEIQFEGFNLEVQTLFCYGADNHQLVQVTASSVRLIKSTTRELLDEWKVPPGFLVNVATANSSQVLLACGGGHLVYLEIGNGNFNWNACRYVGLGDEVSCLDINPIGANPNFSQLAVVGLWTEMSVRLLSLPSLNLLRTEQLRDVIDPHSVLLCIPRSVLLCAFEGVSYLLCGLGDGHLFSYLLNVDTGELTDRKKVRLGAQPVTLCRISTKNATQVFAASDKPTLIHSSNKKLLYANVNSREIRYVCQFNTAFNPDSLAIAKEGELTIGTIGNVQKFHIRTVPLGEHAKLISHQYKSRTFAICTVKYFQSRDEDSEKHFIRLLNDQTFDIISSYSLHENEYGCSILSCSFADDTNVYYCVGTAYVLPEESEPTMGRVLVFRVEYGKLQLITEKETQGSVYSLNSFNGKLLVAVNQNIELYKWTLWDDGTSELQLECDHHGDVLVRCVQTRGDSIVVGDLMKSISLLTYQEGAIQVSARDYNANWITAVEILDGGIYLGAENDLNLFSVRRNSEGATNEARAMLQSVGEYHLGESVRRFRRGSLVRLPDPDTGQIPTVIFGTVNGRIGVIASLPEDLFVILEKLQSNLVKCIESVGMLNHQQWRSFANEQKTVGAKNFLDGDLIESFLDLSQNEMGKISRAMDVEVEVLCEMVEELTDLR